MCMLCVCKENQLTCVCDLPSHNHVCFKLHAGMIGVCNTFLAWGCLVNKQWPTYMMAPAHSLIFQLVCLMEIPKMQSFS